MRGTISRILLLKRSRNGNSYIRVSFKMEDGSFAETNICPDFRNYGRWKNLLIVGKDLEGLIIKGKGAVDADSFPEPFYIRQEAKWIEHEDGTMECVKLEKAPEIKPLPPIEIIQPKLL